MNSEQLGQILRKIKTRVSLQITGIIWGLLREGYQRPGMLSSGLLDFFLFFFFFPSCFWEVGTCPVKDQGWEPHLGRGRSPDLHPEAQQQRRGGTSRCPPLVPRVWLLFLLKGRDLVTAWGAHREKPLDVPVHGSRFRSPFPPAEHCVPEFGRVPALSAWCTGRVMPSGHNGCPRLDPVFEERCS